MTTGDSYLNTTQIPQATHTSWILTSPSNGFKVNNTLSSCSLTIIYQKKKKWLPFVSIFWKKNVLQQKLLNFFEWGGRDDRIVRFTGGFSRGPEFNTEHPHGSP